MLKPFYHLQQECAPVVAPSVVVPVAPPMVAEAPEFSLTDLIAGVMEYCDAHRVNPVRYLALEGDEPRPVVPGYWRPNLLRGCQAKQAYKIHKVPTVRPAFDLQKQFTFDRGNVFEAWLIAYLRAAEAAGCFGVTNIRCGEVVYDQLTGVGGRYDIVFNWAGFDYLIECKSKESSKAFKAVNAALPDHMAQHNDYMAMTGVHAGFVVYFGIEIGVEDPKTGKIDTAKTAIKLRSFFQRFKPALWQETRDRCGMMEWFREDPSVMAPKSTSVFMECEGCVYRAVCDANLSPMAAKAHLGAQ